MNSRTAERTVTGWPKGSNNVAPADRLPEGFARCAINLDFSADGQASLRPDGELLLPLDNARAAFPYGENLVIADGEQLKLFRSSDSSLIDLGPIIGAGPVCAAELAGELFVCTAAERVRIKGEQCLPWGLDPVSAEVTQAAGNLAEGMYRVALTAITADGVESGTVPYVLSLPAGRSIRLQPQIPEGAVAVRLYATVANGDTLYLQQERAAGNFVLDSVRDDTARLMTENLVLPPLASQMDAHNAHLLLVAGSVMYHTEPFMPHLHHRVRGFVAFPAPISVVVSVGELVFVCADKTYAIAGLGTDQQRMLTPLNIGAIPGTGVHLPEGRAAWMTRYGQAIGNKDGSVQLPTRGAFSPPVAERGTAGVLECDGKQTIVTTLRGRIEPNGLGLRDTCDLEIDE